MHAHEQIQPKFTEIKSLERELTEFLDRKDCGVVTVKENIACLEEENENKSIDLKNAKENLEERLEKTVHFHSKAKDCDDWLVAVNEELEKTEVDAEDSETLKMQLSKLEELQDEAINKRSLVDDVSKAGKSLTGQCKNDNKTRRVVLGKVEEMEASYAHVTSRISMHRARMQKLLLKKQDFDATLDDFVKTLHSIDENFNKVKPLDARFEELKLVKQEYEVGWKFNSNKSYRHPCLIFSF